MKTINPQIENTENLKPKKTTPRHILNKLLKNSDNEKNIKVSQRNKEIISQFTNLVMHWQPDPYRLESKRVEIKGRANSSEKKLK